MDIAPDMVLDKPVLDDGGARVGRIVDVGLYDHSRVKFLVVEDESLRRSGRDQGAVRLRRFGIDAIDAVSPDSVRLRVKG